MNDTMFSSIDFGPVQELLENDDVTDISYSNGGQCWLKTLSKGIYRIENPAINNSFMEKLAFQCANAMGKSFNMAYPFLDAEGAELRLNFVHDSIAKNGIACVMRKTPAKIRLEKDKLLKEKYIDLDILDFLVKCVHGHCNIIVCGETGSGKTEFVKYLASQTRENEKLITIEDTLELHLDRIYPTRDIVSMKTNNIASYSDVLVTCMRQNPKWILLSEVRSAEAVMAVRNSISSGHYILSTIHADKASSIPNRMYSLLETNQDIEQFLKSIYRYIQIGIYIRGFQDRETKRFVREIAEVTEFYVTEDNEAVYNTIYQKSTSKKVIRNKPSKYLVAYLDGQGVILDPDEVKTEEELKNELAGIDFDSFVEKTKQIENGQVPGIKTSDEVADIPVKNDVPATPTPQIPQAPMEPQIQPAVVEAQIKPAVVEPQVQPVAPQIPQPVAPQIPQQPMQPSAPVAPQPAPLNPGVETLDF